MIAARRAYSLVELIIVVLVLAALTFIAVPRLQYAALYRKEAATIAGKLTTDLRRTRSLAVCDAANNTDGYKLRMAGSAPYRSYEIVNNDTGEIVDAHTIDAEILCTGGSQFSFGPLGNLLAGSDTQMIVRSEGKVFTITIVPATGMVKCDES